MINEPNLHQEDLLLMLFAISLFDSNLTAKTNKLKLL